MRASVATELRSITPLTDRQRRSTELTVRAAAEIMADRNRLLYALTLPEYLEAWVTPADARREDEKIIARCGTGYVIEYRDHHRQTVVIEGVFRSAATDKVILTWRRAWPNRTRQSLVTIKLYEAGTFTRVELAHSGVTADAEYRWLCDSWCLSLSRLKSLFDRGGCGAFDDPRPRRNPLFPRR